MSGESEAELLPESTIDFVPESEDSTFIDSSKLIHSNTIAMLVMQTERSIKLNGVMKQIEDILFSDTMIQTFAQDPATLLKLYGKVAYHNKQSEDFVLRVMEMSSKNEMFKRILADLFTNGSNRPKPKQLAPADKKKVDEALVYLRKKGLAITHGE